eukprot:2530987-Pleurochrysis_carterae.AAC.4
MHFIKCRNVFSQASVNRLFPANRWPSFHGAEQKGSSTISMDNRMAFIHRSDHNSHSAEHNATAEHHHTGPRKLFPSKTRRTKATKASPHTSHSAAFISNGFDAAMLAQT